jgi:hypothetical protein
MAEAAAVNAETAAKSIISRECFRLFAPWRTTRLKSAAGPWQKEMLIAKYECSECEQRMGATRHGP